MDLFQNLKTKLGESAPKTIVFPEGEDDRILSAAIQLLSEGVASPILLGNKPKIQELAKQKNLDKSIELNIIDPQDYPEDQKKQMVEKIFEIRSGKNTKDEIKNMLEDVNYFGTALVKIKQGDAMVSGAIHSTGQTVLPILQVIKTKPGVKRISSSFIMRRESECYIFSDAAINIDPDAETLAEIAIESAKTAHMIGIYPKIAMLSFSTKGSAKGEMVTKVQQATKIVQETKPDLVVDGELQFDAAFVESVGKSKAPNSKVAGKANVFIFPELQSANIGYKIAQRLGNFEAIGPILQGLNAPVADLSRGCSKEDVYKTSILTLSQAL